MILASIFLLMLVGLSSGYAISNDESIAADNSPMSCFVDSGIIVTFPLGKKLTDQKKRDVLYSLLFAQLASDKQAPRQVDPDNWFKYFNYVLGNIGWVLTSTEFEVNVPDDFFVMSSLALKQLAKSNSFNSSNTLDTFRNIFNTLHSLPDDDVVLELLYNNTYDKESYSSSIILCSFDIRRDNQVELNLLMISVGSNREAAYRYLFHLYDAREVNFDTAKNDVMVLNEMTFEKIRSMVVTKLGSKVDTMIREIEMP